MTFAPAFTAWLDAFFEAYYRRRPVNATFVGVHAYDDRLPDLSEAGVGALAAEGAGLLARLRALPVETLAITERIDRELAEGFLEIQAWEARSAQFGWGNPSLYTGEAIWGALSLLLRPFAPLSDRLELATARLEAIPHVLADGRASLHDAPAEWCGRARRECAGAMLLLGDGIDRLLHDEHVSNSRLRRAADTAREAFVRFDACIESELLPTATYAHACGGETFDLLLRRGHLLDYSADDLERLALDRMAEEEAALACSGPDALPATMQAAHFTARRHAAAMPSSPAPPQAAATPSSDAPLRSPAPPQAAAMPSSATPPRFAAPPDAAPPDAVALSGTTAPRDAAAPPDAAALPSYAAPPRSAAPSDAAPPDAVALSGTAAPPDAAAMQGTATPPDAAPPHGPAPPRSAVPSDAAGVPYLERFAALWRDAGDLAEKADVLTLPDWPVRYVEPPAWVREAAPFFYFLPYRSPAPYDTTRVVDYFVPPAADDSTIKLNHVVHHGSLGHHVQNWHAARAKSRIGKMAAVDCASRIAMLCGGTLAEGWACYATDLAEELGFLTPAERFAQHTARLRMAARAVVDIRLHQGRLTLDAAADFYRQRVGMSAEAAKAEALKNSLFPGTACMYLAGWDGIWRLRRELSTTPLNSISLRQFHQQLLAFGSVPVSLVGRAMREANNTATASTVLAKG